MKTISSLERLVLYMKNNVIYVDFSKKCRIYKSNLLLTNLVKFIKKVFKINSRSNVYKTTFYPRKSKRIL